MWFTLSFCFQQEEKKTDGKAAESAVSKKYIKHPLQNKWALWFFKNDKSKSWTDNLRLVTSFDTVSFFSCVVSDSPKLIEENM